MLDTPRFRVPLTLGTPADSGTELILPSPSTATLNHITLTNNCSITLPDAKAGQALTVLLKQDEQGGRTVTWDTALWAGGTPPTLSTDANAMDVLVFICIDNTNWMGFVSGLDMK